MSKETDPSYDYLVNKINLSDNEQYRQVMLSMLSILWAKKIFKILNESWFKLDTHDALEKWNIVKAVLVKMDEAEQIHNAPRTDYIQNLFENNTINSKNIAKFIRDNDKYFDTIMFVLCHRDSERERNQMEVNTLLCEAVKDEALEKRLLEKAMMIQKKDGNAYSYGNSLAGYMINAYISNKDIDKALRLHQEMKSIYIGKLFPVRFFKRMVREWHIDEVTNYFITSDKIKKEFNGWDNRQFQNLQKILKIFLEVDQARAVDFFIKPEIVAMQYWQDAWELIDIMVSSNTDESLFFKYITAETISNLKYRGDRFAKYFEMIGKQYWANFLKKVLLNNDWIWWKKVIEWSAYNKFDPNESWEKMLKRISNIYSSWVINECD